MYLPDEMKEEMRRNILSRLRKIEGQVRGLQGMVSGDKECEQILTQLRAAQSALKSVTSLVFKSPDQVLRRNRRRTHSRGSISARWRKPWSSSTKSLGG